MTAVITMAGVGKSLGGREILRDVSLDVQAGDVVGIIGPSGAGKSTLLRVVNQLERHDRGTLAIEGAEIERGLHDRRLTALRSRIGMVFQGFHLWPHMTALGNVIEAPMRVRGVPRRIAVEEGHAALARVGLDDRAHHTPAQLSGGQQQRVAIARALAMQPIAILFDEPTASLDPGLTKEVLSTMTALAQTGVTMLVVTHEMAFARRVSNRMVFMQSGRILQDRPTAAFFEAQDDEGVQRFLTDGV